MRHDDIHVVGGGSRSVWVEVEQTVQAKDTDRKGHACGVDGMYSDE